MPYHVARMLGSDSSVRTVDLMAALDFLNEKHMNSARLGQPASFYSYRNAKIIRLALEFRGRLPGMFDL